MLAKHLVKRRFSSLSVVGIHNGQTRNYAKVSSFRYTSSNFYRHSLTSSKEDEILKSYKEKLEKKAREVGAKDLNELKDKLKDQIKEKIEKYNKVDPLKELDDRLSAAESGPTSGNVIKINKPLAPNTKKAADDNPPFKTLSSYIDVEKISELGVEDINFIWRARFQSNPQNVCSVISKDVFDGLYRNARKNPFFILPLKKEHGHELHFVQWSFAGPHTTHVIFTTLAEYKLHNEFAKPHTTLTFHEELEADKGIVLMNGHVEKDSNVNLNDSQLLILNLQNFYGGLQKDNLKRLSLLEAFNKGTSDFSIEELIKESQDVE